MAPTLPVPGVQHGQRIFASLIEQRANDPSSNGTWASIPVDENNLESGFRDLSYWNLNNAANHAAQWLGEHLPEDNEAFQCFAYAGPKDLRYPILALAAAKLQKVMILPSPLITPEAQVHILEKRQCTIYLRPAALAVDVSKVVEKKPDIRVFDVPSLETFLQDMPAPPCVYPKTWAEGSEDPWLVFHTSGTTGNPRPVPYTQRMMAWADVVAAGSGTEEGLVHQLAGRRWYTPLPSLHLIGTMFVLAFTTYLDMTAIIGPAAPPSPETMTQMLQHTHIDGIIVPPAIIDGMVRDEVSLTALRSLQYVYYAGAPLLSRSADLLTPYTRVAPVIGSTEGCGYLTKMYSDHSERPYDNVAFHEKAGAVFEPHFGDLHELVFVRQEDSSLQPIFRLYPELDRYPTKDVWVEHPVWKGHWRIVGRTDDYVTFSHGEGLHASRLEPEIEAHPGVKTAIIGGHGFDAPVLLVEMFGGIGEEQYEMDTEALKKTLQPYLDKVNGQCHECVRLNPQRIVFATAEKPFVQTAKGSVARMATLRLYESEIASVFA